MKKLLSLLICLLCSEQMFAQYPTQLNNHAIVDFTATVDLKKEGTQTYFFAPLDEEGKIIEVAHVVDLSRIYADSSFFKDSYNDSMVSDLLLHNLPSQIEGMKLISKNMITLGKMRGIDFVYKIVQVDNELPSKYIYLRGVLKGHELYYLFVFLADTDAKSLKIKNHFFNSLKVN